MEDLLPFGFHDDGMPDENVIDVPVSGVDDYYMIETQETLNHSK
jgi:hypothetical protein